ncbi:acyl-CoA dehydrogenase family protein [Sulfitobacter sp. F26204]|uniref:acyl-CoA dehydrogenase family protein n=1 Tax=Sulfitobacter sp. F26204 TaxID=2996014 RepID=UPI00225E3050|nr:acyl-CoA dehydrogenase family protein [Sulfitobacter sp. F26204]MCX7560630.1 acyl-CoA dehydrogenase family protein [Sulfitobacter sp. F26204]
MIRRRIFDEEHVLFRDSVRKWIGAYIRPNINHWHAQGMVDREIWLKAGEAGYLAMFAEEKYGGLGLDDFRFDQILIEELTRVDSSFQMALHSRIVAPYIHNLGSEDQKRRFMPGIVSGACILAIALTEPGTGSDLAGLTSRAEDRGDHWLLNGAKTYISNGQLADLVVVAARTDPAATHCIGLFLVERGMQGFDRGRNLKKLGLCGQDTSELFFQDVKIPKENVLGDPMQGFRALMINLAEERLGGAIQFVARAERALEITQEFIMERKAFGRPIGTFQNSRFKMAEMRTQLDAAWTMVDHCVIEHVEKNLSAEMAAEVKLFTSDVEAQVVDTCLQLHGGAGYMDEYEINRHYRDARISRIYAGSSEIMKEIIGRAMGLDERRK